MDAKCSFALPLKDLRMIQMIRRFHRDKEGAALAEYGLLIALIAVVCIAAITAVGVNVQAVFNSVAAAI
jgi:pilus assembly protein Flp/PilA